MEFPWNCPHCNHLITYLTILDGKKVCMSCKKPLPIEKKGEVHSVISGKGGKRIVRT